MVDLGALAFASLHHRGCKRPEWSQTPRLSSGEHLTWNAKTFLLPGMAGDEPDFRPLFLVNPGLEQVALHRDAGADTWVIGTVSYYRDLGLRTPFRDFVVDEPIPGISAKLNADVITVRVEDHPQVWTCPVDGQVGHRVRELGGITLGVTSAINPSEVMRFDQLLELMQSGDLAMGWVDIEETARRRPLRETPAPAALSTYLLHWGNNHATVGELLATTDTSLIPEQARAWAEGHVEDPDRLIGWQQVNLDPAAWYTIDAISVEMYVVRRHADGWKLIKVLARIDGAVPDTEDDLREWAESAVRTKAKTRIINWVPAPSTAEDFTTLHGSAPRSE